MVERGGAEQPFESEEESPLFFLPGATTYYNKCNYQMEKAGSVFNSAYLETRRHLESF